MTTATNQDIMKSLAQAGTPWTISDNNNASFATAANAQSLGVMAKGEIFRVVQSVATGAVVLPSITGLDGVGPIMVCNDSPNSINVGAGAGEKINNVATTSAFGAGIQAIAAGAACLFIPAGQPLGTAGNPPVAASVNYLNWHAFPGTGA